jgi:hypothetical protein
MINRILVMLVVLILSCQPILAETNEKSEVKTYIIQPGTKIIYPSGKVFNVSHTMWLLEYGYGIGLRQDAGLWIDNEPIFLEKIKNRDALILNQNNQLTNRNMYIKNLEMINGYNLNYMNTMKDVFGKPEKILSRGDAKLWVGILIGVTLTLGSVAVGGYAVRTYRK